MNGLSGASSSYELQARKIVSNMESVINSVKKQRRHKKKKQSQEEEPEISDISNILSNSLSFVSPNINHDEMLNACKDINIGGCNPPINWKNHLLDGLKHKRSRKENDPGEHGESSNLNNDPDINSTSMKNAFEMMMNARNKSIGQNSPGKELCQAEGLSTPAIDCTKAQRKIMMTEWAERKGALKRKLDEEANDKYIQNQLNKRAKRLKNMISLGKSKSNEESSKLKSNIANDQDSLENDLLEKVQTKSVCNESNRIIEQTNKTDENTKSTKRNSKKKQNSCSESEETKNGILPTEQKVSAKKEEIVELIDDDVICVNCDDSEQFLQVLASPIKKRDSLLGYFNRLDKSGGESNTEAKKNPSTIKKQKKNANKLSVKRKLTQTCTTTEKSNVSNQLPETPVKRDVTPTGQIGNRTPTNERSPVRTPNGRPRRVCRNRPIIYSVDLEVSPVKTAANKILKRARRQLTESPDKKLSPVTPQHKVNNRTPKKRIDATPKSTQTQKIASIFLKTQPKLTVDPAVLKARQEFLMSGIPDCMRVEIEKQRLYEETFEQELESFPSISHIQQVDNSEEINNYRQQFELKFRSKNVDVNVHVPRKFHLGKPIERIKLKLKPFCPDETLQVYNSKSLIRSIKDADGSNFPYFRCFKQLRNKYEAEVGPIKTDTDTMDLSNDGVVVIENDPLNLNGCRLFTEKYKPQNSTEVLVNSEPINQLKKFLTAWQENRNRLKRNYDSSDDFECSSASNSNSNFAANEKSVILLGPYGCGKTMAVYAIANDLRFNVLEINAGCIRTGKKILKKLQEATQSHQVKNKNDKFTETGGSQRDADFFYNASTSEDSGTCSLILIEDADVVLEQDIGFIEAINQLIATSKRPVILSANQQNCPHIAKFIMHQNVIYFNLAKSEPIAKWMSTVSIIERCYVRQEECKRLYNLNGGDLRRTLLEFQFFLQSGGDMKRCLQNNKTIDKVEHYNHLRLLDIFKPYANTLSCLEKGSIINSKSNDKLRTILENYTSVDRLLATEQNDRMQNNLSEEIAMEIVRLTTTTSTKTDSIQTFDSIMPKTLSSGITMENRTRSIYLDYEPNLRSICRAEKSRIKYERRTSRFYHYLRNISSNNPASFSPDIFDSYCEILQSIVKLSDG